MRWTLRMCSEYEPLATLTVCTERAIRQLLLKVRNNSATVLDMTDQRRKRKFSGRAENLEVITQNF